jgi:DMSO/TMAO reductase YedYZ heme-binding membrane subunit
MKRADELRTVRRVLATAVALSAVHYYDNTVRFEDYTGGQASDGFITRPVIPISLVLFTMAGVAGYRALKGGNRRWAGVGLAVYSVSGLIGLGHYTTVAPSEFSAFQNTFIALDFLAGLAVLILAVRVATRGSVSRPPTTTGRSPVGSASR